LLRVISQAMNEEVYASLVRGIPKVTTAAKMASEYLKFFYRHG
jgi:hypothetical protein